MLKSPHSLGHSEDWYSLLLTLEHSFKMDDVVVLAATAQAHSGQIIPTLLHLLG